MKSDQIAQAKVDIEVALRLIELGHLEPAQEVLRFAIAELNDALSILEVGDIDLLASAPARPTHAQPTQWESHQIGGTTHCQGTDQNGGERLSQSERPRSQGTSGLLSPAPTLRLDIDQRGRCCCAGLRLT